MVSRRGFLGAGAAAALVAARSRRGWSELARPSGQLPLDEVGYGDVTVRSPEHAAQMENTRTVLMGISDDSLMRPFRMMAGQPAPGEEIGGWYEYKADYDFKTGDAGLSPGASFGQWTSALARMSVAAAGSGSAFLGGQAGSGSASAAVSDPALASALRDKVLRVNRLYAGSITPEYYRLTRLPGYSFEKTVCGLKDAHGLLGDPEAFGILDHAADAAVAVLPGRPVDREVPWYRGRDISWDWDENFTLPENLYLAYRMGAGRRYLAMAEQYLDDATFFDPLSRGENVLYRRHGYSYVNAMSSAMQAYLMGGSELHLRAAVNGFDMLEQQSFATGGWGPDEILASPDWDKLYASLTSSHNNFEAPCCAFAHFKLTRYLLRVRHEGRYGDSMERVMYNTVLGALPMHPDGRAFYFQDYNDVAKRGYSVHRWPCCAGTLPQVAADYGINSYFRNAGAVWVNLYVASELRWAEDGTQLRLEQEGGYPHAGDVRLTVTASVPARFALHLRIPAWAERARQPVQLRVNGRRWPVQLEAGFTRVEREWRTGDVVELELPMELRLEQIPGSLSAQHPETVALMRGPLVLFPLGAGPHRVSQAEALAARQTGARAWVMQTQLGSVQLLPFTEVGEQMYSTYLRLA